MIKNILLTTILLAGLNCFSSNAGQYFRGGLQYGMSLNTIYRYTTDFSYFDEFNSGKKLTGTFGLFIHRSLSNELQLESGFLYQKRGTRYREHYRSNKKSYGFTTYVVDLHYLSFPIVVNQRKSSSRQCFYRLGLDIGYLFSTNIPHALYDPDLYLKEFDIEGLFGFKWKPFKVNFFKNKEIVIDLKCSLFPIIQSGKELLLDGDAGFNILSNQRNVSLSVSIQHIFD